MFCNWITRSKAARRPPLRRNKRAGTASSRSDAPPTISRRAWTATVIELGNELGNDLGDDLGDELGDAASDAANREHTIPKSRAAFEGSRDPAATPRAINSMSEYHCPNTRFWLAGGSLPTEAVNAAIAANSSRSKGSFSKYGNNAR